MKQEFFTNTRNTWNQGSKDSVLNKEIRRTFLFCLYLGSFSLASVRVKNNVSPLKKHNSCRLCKGQIKSEYIYEIIHFP